MISFLPAALIPAPAKVSLAMLIACLCSSAGLAADAPRSPIRHVIVIVGENHSFDNMFGVYRPIRAVARA